MAYEVVEVPNFESGAIDVVLADPESRDARSFSHYAFTVGCSSTRWNELADRRGVAFGDIRLWSGEFLRRNPDLQRKLSSGQSYRPGESVLEQAEFNTNFQSDTAMRIGALELLANIFSGRISAHDKDPFPHQLAFQHYMSTNLGRVQRVLIADEVGLGKTIETGLVLRDLLIARGSIEEFSCLYLTSGGLCDDAQGKLREVMRGSIGSQPIVELVGSFASYGEGNTRGVHVGSMHAARLYTTSERKKRLPTERVAPDIVVIDECHHCASGDDLTNESRIMGHSVTRTYQAAYQIITGTFWPNSAPPSLVILMSATPFRSRPQFVNLLRLLTHGIAIDNDRTFDAYSSRIGAEDITRAAHELSPKVAVVWRQQNDPMVTRWTGGRLFPNLRIIRPHTGDLPEGTPRLTNTSDSYLEMMHRIRAAVSEVCKAHGAKFGGFAISQLEKKLTSSSLAGACWVFAWCVRHSSWKTKEVYHADSSAGALGLRQLILDISQRLAKFAGGNPVHSDVEFPSEQFSFKATALGQRQKERDNRIDAIYDFSRTLRDSGESDDAPFTADSDEIERLTGLALELLRFTESEGSGVENAKLNWLSTMMDQHPAERFLVFTESLQTCTIITSAVQKSAALTGSLDTTARKSVVGRFVRGEIRVLVATSAADEGIDLQATNRIVHWDLSSSPATLMQRNGRAARLGATRDVTAYYLIMAGTHEERRDRALRENFADLGITDESLRLRVLGALSELEQDEVEEAIVTNKLQIVGDILRRAQAENEKMGRDLQGLSTALNCNYALDRNDLQKRLEVWSKIGIPDSVEFEIKFNEIPWKRPVFAEISSLEEATAKIAEVRTANGPARMTFDPEYQIFSGDGSYKLAGLRPWTSRRMPSGTVKHRPDGAMDPLGALSCSLARLGGADFAMVRPDSLAIAVERAASAKFLLFATHPMREAETVERTGAAQFLACYPFDEDLNPLMGLDGLSAEEVHSLIECLEQEALDRVGLPSSSQLEQARAAGREIGTWTRTVRRIGGGGMFATAHYFLPIPVALVMVACVGDAQPELVSGIDDTSERVIEAASRAFHNNRETEAVDLLVEHFDGLFLARDFRAAGRALSKLDPQQFPPKVLTGVLMVSAHAREELGSERADFFERVKSALSGKWGLDPESIDSVVRRLK